MSKWSKFIIRHEVHGQNLSYPDACGAIVDTLLAKGKLSLLELMIEISQALRQNKQAFFSEKILMPNPDFYGAFDGELRDSLDDKPPLPPFPKGSMVYLGNRYLPFYHDFKQKVNSDIYSHQFKNEARISHGKLTFLYKSEEHEPPITLSHIYLNEKSLYFAPLNMRLWDRIEKLYLTSTDTNLSAEEREAASADFYSLLSHSRFWNMKRGGATASRIALEYIDAQNGVERAPCKENLSLNMEAILSAPSEFRQRFVNGEYFDQTVNLDEITQWQQFVVAGEISINR